MTNEEAIKVLKMAIQAIENWAYLKEHITEMRDANGTLNQNQTCQFILTLMSVIEREGDEK